MEIPPRKPPQVSIIMVFLVIFSFNRINNVGTNTEMYRIINAATIMIEETNTKVGLILIINNSKPISTNNNAFRISSTSSQNLSTYSVVCQTYQGFFRDSL